MKRRAAVDRNVVRNTSIDLVLTVLYGVLFGVVVVALGVGLVAVLGWEIPAGALLVLVVLVYIELRRR